MKKTFTAAAIILLCAALAACSVNTPSETTASAAAAPETSTSAAATTQTSPAASDTSATSATTAEPEAVITADSAEEAFGLLNGDDDAAEFEDKYEKLMAVMKEKGIDGDFEALIRQLSAYYDYLQSPTLLNVMKNYRFTGLDPDAGYIDLDKCAELAGDGFGKNFTDKLYIPDCELLLPPALWMPGNLYEYCGLIQPVDPEHVDDETLIAVFDQWGFDGKAEYENCPSWFDSFYDYVRSFCMDDEQFELVVRSARGEQLEGLSVDTLELPSDLSKPLTAIFIDNSEGIKNTSWGGMWSDMLNADRADIMSRAEKIYTDIRAVSGEKIVFTGNPALADIVIVISETTPTTGFYKAGDDDVLVFNTRLDIYAKSVSMGQKMSFYAENNAGAFLTVSLDDSGMYYMSTPEIINDPELRSFSDKILSWYGEKAESSGEFPVEHIICATPGGENVYNEYLLSDREKSLYEYCRDYFGYTDEEFGEQIKWSTQ